jgi:uncharacterized protein with FMN-binding domain
VCSSDDVVVTVSVDAEGKITAITADVSGETPTFGGRCVTDEAFMNQFIGKTIPVTVDALSRATVTSKAIETAINSIEVAAPAVEEEVAEEAPAAAGTEYTASAKGFKSDVVVTVTVDAEGKITAITADVSGETPTFGGRCVTDEAFMNQFIGKTIPVTVDVLSGATVTSKAIETAINSLAK